MITVAELKRVTKQANKFQNEIDKALTFCKAQAETGRGATKYYFSDTDLYAVGKTIEDLMLALEAKKLQVRRVNNGCIRISWDEETQERRNANVNERRQPRINDGYVIRPLDDNEFRDEI